MKQTLLIGIFGMLGALLRVGIGQWIGEGSSFPIATFTVNMIATGIFCLLSVGLLEKITENEDLHKAITVGFLGSFSTFSAFSIETIVLVENGHPLIASSYVLASLFAGLIVAQSTFYLSRKLVMK